MSDNQPHPARYSPGILIEMASLLGSTGANRVLDPFAGTGLSFELEQLVEDIEVTCVEIEPEWAAHNPRTKVGSALHLPFGDGEFDAVCTSPTYGNRMADTYTDGTRRHTYTAYLGRKLTPGNSGAMQWGAQYRQFHVLAWAECARVLKPQSWMIVDCKNHYRGGKLQYVTKWHAETISDLGFRLVEYRQVAAPGQRHGRNGNLRLDYSVVMLFERRDR